MNKFINIVLILILINLPVKIFSQENICDCCSYSSLQYQENYEDIFNPAVIKSERIKAVIVYTKPNKSSESSVIDKYREIKFKFNNEGLVISKTWYNRMGKPHSTYDLKRNKFGKIIQKTFNYIDSLERKSTSFGQRITDYEYDNKGRLIKIKIRGTKGQILADEKSDYFTIKYDSLDRVIQRKRHMYWSYKNESTTSITEYTYSNNTFSSKYNSFRNGELSLSGETKYNKNWKVTYDKTFNEALKKDAFEEHFEYDSSNRIIKYQSIAGNGAGSECPDDGNYADKYEYDDIGLLINIKHTFDQNICEMTFEYRK